MSTTVTIFQNTIGTSSDTDNVQETLSSIQRLMALSGLSWDYKQSKSEHRCTPCSVATCIYSSLVCIFFILILVEVIPMYAKADSFTETTTAITNHIVVVLLLIHWGLSTNIHSKIRVFCKRLHETHLKFTSSVPNPLLRKKLKRASLCLQVFAVLMCVACGISTGMRYELSSGLYWPLIVLNVLYGGCGTLQNMSLLLLFLTISLLLTNGYDVCTLRLTRVSEGSVKEEEIEEIRDYHASLTDLVDYVCSFISIHVAATYLSCLLNLCFCLYIFINDISSIDYISFTAYFVFAAALNVITLTYLGVRLHEATQVTLFTNKLSQRQIGITASGLVTITKDTVLTIIGTLLTYVFIVIQFKPESTAGLRQNANTTAG